jgi:hypothetical protein
VAVLERAIEELAGRDRDLTLRLEAVMEQSLYRAAGRRLDRLDPGVRGDSRGERALLAALATEGLLRTGRAAQVREWSRRAFERGLLEDQAPYSSLWGNAAFPLIFADGLRRGGAGGGAGARGRAPAQLAGRLRPRSRRPLDAALPPGQGP